MTYPIESTTRINNLGLHSKKILVVDDEEFVCNLVSKILEKYLGFEVNKAKNGSEAIAGALTGVYDAAIIDLSMPNTSGMKAIKAIKTMCPNFPIIAMSGKQMDFRPSEIEKELGCDRFLQKPFKISSLILEITSLFDTDDQSSETEQH